MEKQIEINGVNFNYSVEGEGIPVVLMHGWGCNRTTLASIEKLLVPYFKVYNVDFPGFGKSTEPQTVWGIEDYTRLTEEFLKKENIENPILLGHSFGGRVGILLSSRNKVRKLILVDAAGIKPRHSMKYYIKVYSYKTVKHALPLLLGKTKGEEMLNRYRKRVGSSDYSSASVRMRQILSKVVNEDLTWALPKSAARHCSYGAPPTLPLLSLTPARWNGSYRMPDWWSFPAWDITASSRIHISLQP